MTRPEDRRFWQDRPTLVTGATGLVGGATVRRLLEAGADVVCAVRDHVPQSELTRSGMSDRVKIARGDVRDQAFLERVIGEYESSVVIHLAAQTIVGIANRNPVSTFESNIAGTWTLLEAARRSPAVKAVVIASSDKAYGTAEHLPTPESDGLHGDHPYDVSKSCADLIARSYAITWKLPVAITRCGNFYGGGDLNWNRIVPGTIRSVLRGQAPVVRSDGKFVRDYIYVEDAASAYLALSRALVETPSLCGEAFNFSNEKPASVIDVVDRILALMKSDLRPQILNQASNEIREQYLDATKAKKMLGWNAAFDLDAGLARTIEWYRAFFAAEAA